MLRFQEALSELVKPPFEPIMDFSLYFISFKRLFPSLWQPPFAKWVRQCSSSQLLPHLPPSKKIAVAVWPHLRFSPEGSLISFQSVHLIDHVYFPSPCGSLRAAIRQKLDLKHPFHALPGEFLKPCHLLLAFGAKPKREALSIKRLSKWIMWYFETCNKEANVPVPLLPCWSHQSHCSFEGLFGQGSQRGCLQDS